MINKKQYKIISVILILVLTCIFAFFLNENLNKLKKLKSSVIDPETGASCNINIDPKLIDYENTIDLSCTGEDYCFDGSYIEYHDYNTLNVDSALELLRNASIQHCEPGYSCNKPDMPVSEEADESCTNISSNEIEYNIKFSDFIQDYVDDLEEVTNVEDVLSNLYKISKSDFFCPKKYCEPNIYKINLDKNGGNGGTDEVYLKFGTGYYLDENATQVMSYLDNPINIPTKSYTVTYNDNNQGATFTTDSSQLNAPFIGYFPDMFTDEKYEYVNKNYGYQYLGPYGFYNEISSFDLEYSESYSPDSNSTSFYQYGSIDEEFPTNNSLVNQNGYLNIYYLKCDEDDCTYYYYPPFPSTQDSYPINWTYLYLYYEDNGIEEYDPNSNIYFNSIISDTLYAEYGFAKVNLPTITKENHVCFWVDENKGEDYSPNGNYITIADDTNLNAVCIPEPKITVITNYCDSDGTNCAEENREILEYSYTNYNDDITVLPANNDENYKCNDGQEVLLDGNHTVIFNCTYDNYYNTFNGYNNDTDIDIEINSDNSGATLSTYKESYNDNCWYDEEMQTWYGCYVPWNIKIWPAGENGAGENEILQMPSGSLFSYSYFNSSMPGYDATYRDKYGIYFANSIDSIGDDQSEYEPLEIRPYVQVKYKVDGQIYGETQVKQANNSINILNPPYRPDMEFRVWQAYAETVNSDGMNGATASEYSACTHDNGDYNNDYNVYFEAGTYIETNSWNFSNGSYPCPSKDGYVNNIITIYLEAIYFKEPWVEIY